MSRVTWSGELEDRQPVEAPTYDCYACYGTRYWQQPPALGGNWVCVSCHPPVSPNHRPPIMVVRYRRGRPTFPHWISIATVTQPSPPPVDPAGKELADILAIGWADGV